MNAAPFDTQLIIERLRLHVTALRDVFGAADFAAVKNLADFPAPCAYVLMARDKAAEAHVPGHGERGTQVRATQRLVVNFGVILAVRNYRAQRGQPAADDLKAILGPARDALLGYVPDVPGARPCQLVQGDLSDYDASTVLWTDVWQTQQTIGANP